MQWVMRALAVVALMLAGVDVLGTLMNMLHIHDVEKRVNILDEVSRVHSEEIDELQRSVYGAKPFRDSEDEKVLKELEEMGNNVSV